MPPNILDPLGFSQGISEKLADQGTNSGRVIQQGSKGTAAGQTIETRIVTGRLSWRQILNYLTLKNAP